MKQFKDEKHQLMRKNQKLQYEADGLKNCRENGTLIGQKKVANSANQQFLINKYMKEMNERNKKGDNKQGMEIFNKFYAEKFSDEFDKMKEAEQYMVLTNYIDMYQEKLGLYGTQSKKTEVEKVLKFCHKDLVRKANEVYIDFESYRKAKLDLTANSSVSSSLRENCIKRGFPKKFIESLKPTEISMRVINQAIKRNPKIRKNI